MYVREGRTAERTSERAPSFSQAGHSLHSFIHERMDGWMDGWTLACMDRHDTDGGLSIKPLSLFVCLRDTYNLPMYGMCVQRERSE